MLQCDALHGEQEEGFPFFFCVCVLMTQYLLDVSCMSTCVFMDGFQTHVDAFAKKKSGHLKTSILDPLFFLFFFLGPCALCVCLVSECYLSVHCFLLLIIVNNNNNNISHAPTCPESFQTLFFLFLFSPDRKKERG